jgi:deoxyuridine 5'-triphosphate nucleotidohydrolase
VRKCILFQTMLVKKMNQHACIPTRASPGAAGYDLYSSETITIQPNSKALIPTGVSVALPEGTYGRIAPRSGMSWKHHTDVGAGVIDRDYRGEVKVILFNLGSAPVFIDSGQRIAQLIVTKIETPLVEIVDDLDKTERDSGGFGSTGK